MAKELLDFDLAFRLVAIDHVAEKKGLAIAATIISVLDHQHDVHFDEANLTDVAQLQSLHVLELGFVVEHMETVCS